MSWTILFDLFKEKLLPMILRREHFTATKVTIAFILVFPLVLLRATRQIWRGPERCLVREEAQPDASLSAIKNRETVIESEEEAPPVTIINISPATPLTSQPWDAFLVVDVEGTCIEGGSFDYPNEIIVRAIFCFLLD